MLTVMITLLCIFPKFFENSVSWGFTCSRKLCSFDNVSIFNHESLKKPANPAKPAQQATNLGSCLTFAASLATH